jgi:large subunit ribosomal protein L29
MKKQELLKNLREKSADELNEELTASLREQFNLRMQKVMPESSVRIHDFKRVRRNIARIKTILSSQSKSTLKTSS